MEYFIGIVPPKDYLKRIERFQSKWTTQSGVEPHITVKAQGGLRHDKQWIDQVKKVCINIKPFKVSLGQPKVLGGHILYMSVHSDDLHQLHQSLVHEISPGAELIQQYFELDAYTPHLTICKVKSSIDSLSVTTEQKLKQLKESAEKELTPYPVFDVNFIRIYELDYETYRCSKVEDIALGH
ncbi:2'-5' RNA ligase [Jeotgalibacillus terrae]|nr:2'-5' RNA ligase [Jeotgalibacillus terrae]